MSTELKAAQLELEPDIRREINWFVPEGEKHFIDPVTISVVSGVLLSAFFTGVLKGFGEEIGKKTGNTLGDWVIDSVQAIISGEHHDQAQVEHDAETARAELRVKLQGIDSAQVTANFDQVEHVFRSGFEKVMPEGRAEKLATRIRHVAAKVI